MKKSMISLWLTLLFSVALLTGCDQPTGTQTSDTPLPAISRTAAPLSGRAYTERTPAEVPPTEEPSDKPFRGTWKGRIAGVPMTLILDGGNVVIRGPWVDRAPSGPMRVHPVMRLFPLAGTYSVNGSSIDISTCNYLCVTGFTPARGTGVLKDGALEITLPLEGISQTVTVFTKQ